MMLKLLKEDGEQAPCEKGRNKTSHIAIGISCPFHSPYMFFPANDLMQISCPYVRLYFSRWHRRRYTVFWDLIKRGPRDLFMTRD